MTLAERLADHRMVVCAGPGGAGKTTISAALALGLALEGRRVAVVTIDPARRLADALGVGELRNEPTRVPLARLRPPGQLWAMTLDPQRTFDDLVDRLAGDAAVRDQVLANPVYRHLSGAVAGSQELTAVAKLYELDRSGAFDAIVLDTPPSRNALDFLDVCDRLLAFLDGRAVRILLAPGGAATRAASLTLGLLRRITGAGLIGDVEDFLAAASGMLGGFRGRVAAVRELLADPATTFLVVASPARAPVAEAIFFGERLRERGLSCSGVVVNRVHPLDPGGEDAEATARRLEPRLGAPLARRVARAHASIQVLARRDADSVRRLAAGLGDPHPIAVPDLASDVHDVGGLLAVHAHLLGSADDRAAAPAPTLAAAPPR